MNFLSNILEKKSTEVVNLPDHRNVPYCQCDFNRLGQRGIFIAEIKAASPSFGQISDIFDPTAQAQKYIEGGAEAISILTDKEWFGGSFKNLRDVRAMTDTPLLCKDFIIDEKQVRHARMHGADIVLLIVKALTPDKIRELKDCVENLGMKALVEIQNEDELTTAQSIGADFILLNTRDLVTFVEDREGANLLAPKVPNDMTLIYASGIKTPKSIAQLPKNIDGCLIGTALMKSPNPAQFIRQARGFLPR